ncbi:hypothetical protein HYN59_01480 [Flavobacterium album]|uniref:Uncharacterized protein n=1 Tax=Flavobacterium album TaxID=2175091 RepID=A0A2S1QTX3_9FLAO|nr:hypothetical protein [Flavobacterium album]AWH83867.1 hypothetical protein HYN59_01480 [Flavobacterium album]
MKTLHKINTWAVVTNLFLCIIPFLGMLALLPLGLLQLILAFIITGRYYRNLDRKRRSVLLKYWLFVTLEVTIMVVVCLFDGFSDLSAVFLLFLFPACIAIYFVYTTYTITKYFKYGNTAPQH